MTCDQRHRQCTPPPGSARGGEYAGAKRDYPWCQWGMAKLTYGGAVNLPKNLIHAHAWYQLAVDTDFFGKEQTDGPAGISGS